MSQIDNYFDHFDLPVSFLLNEKKLKDVFLKRSKEYHPDFYSQAEETIQSNMLAMSSLNNKAYKTLKRFYPRFKYVLELCGLDFEEGNQSIPQSFLMEMMDFNESLMDAQMEMDQIKIKKLSLQLEQIKKEDYNKILPIIESFDIDLITEDQKTELKNHYLKSKYLDRIAEKLR